MKKLIFFLIKLFIFAFIITLGYIVFKENTFTKSNDYDSIIVLGAQVKEDGSLSNQLRLRMESSLAAYKNRDNVMIVTTGSKGLNEPIAEAIAMKEWLVQNGVNENDIITEIKSKTTYENIKFSIQFLEQYNLKKPLIITSDYHLPRAILIANDLGINAQGLPAKTDSQFWLKNRAREVLAWWKYFYLKYVKGL